jgi:hypothetical protein
MEVDAQAFGQLIPTWSDLRMVLDGLEARLDLPMSPFAHNAYYVK